jgi:hypothetical protein
MKYYKHFFQSSIILLLSFISLESKAQLTLGLEGGITFSAMTDLDYLYTIVPNATYEVSNLNIVNGYITLGYTFKKFSFGVKCGSITTGFSEMAVVYNTENFRPPEIVGRDRASNGKYLSDFTYKTRYDFIDININVGYKIANNIKVNLGVSQLKYLEHLHSTFVRIQAYPALDNSNLPPNITKIRMLDSEGGEIDPFRVYGDDIAITLGVDFTIYKGLYLQLSYLRGFNKMLPDFLKNDTHNQAFNFNIGYQWTLKKGSKY